MHLAPVQRYFPGRSLFFIDIQRLSQFIYEGENSRAAEDKFLVFSKAFLDFRSKLGRTAHRGENLRDEREAYIKGSRAPPAHEFLAAAGTIRPSRKLP